MCACLCCCLGVTETEQVGECVSMQVRRSETGKKKTKQTCVCASRKHNEVVKHRGVCECACVHSHHISGQVAEVVKGTLQGVGVHVQNDHILQRATAHSLK